MQAMELFRAIGWSVLVLVSCRAMGGYLLRPFAHKAAPDADGILKTGIGFILLSNIVLALVMGQVVRKPVLAVLLAVLAAMVLLHAVRNARTLGLAMRRALFSVWAIPYFCYGAILLLYAALPPLRPDSLSYHLEVPKRILEAEGWRPFYDNIFAYFPQFGEMLMVPGLSFGGVTAANLTQAVFLLLLGLACYRWIAGRATAAAAHLGVWIFLSVPTVLVSGGWAYVDLIYAFYAFLALLQLLHWLRTPRRYHAVLCGLFTGTCAAVKYTGITYAILLILIVLIYRLRRRDNQSWQQIPWMLVAFMLPVLPYAVRNYLETGWPLFPFFSPGLALHGAFNWDAERARLLLGWLASFGAPLGENKPVFLLIAPVRVFMSFHFEDPQWYFGIAGPVFLLTPFVLKKIYAKNDVKRLLLFSVLFLYAWAMTTRQVRFLLPVLPVLAGLIAEGCFALRSNALRLTVFLLVGLNLFFSGRELAAYEPLNYWTGKESAETYLTRRLPVYKIYNEANRLCEEGDRLYLIHMKNYGYYLDCPWGGDFIFERYEIDSVLERDASVQALVGFFEEKKITKILMDRNMLGSPQFGLAGEKLQAFREFIENYGYEIARDGHFSLVRIRTEAAA